MTDVGGDEPRVDGMTIAVRYGAISPSPTLTACWPQHARFTADCTLIRALHRLGLARYRPDGTVHLADWAALVRSCGWW